LIVIQTTDTVESIHRANQKAVKRPRTGRPYKTHPYGGGGASRKIVRVLKGLVIDDKLRRKLITY
jgi:hypothetical protein